jgi:hypothetical protein
MYEKVSDAAVGVAIFVVVGLTLYASVRFTGSVSSGFVVLVAMGAVFLWSRFASSGTSPADFAVNIVFALLILLGVLLVFGLIFDEATVTRCVLLTIVMAIVA